MFTLILQGPCFPPVLVSPPILHTPTHMQIPTVSPSEAFSRCEERLGSETVFCQFLQKELTEGCRAAVQFECVCTRIKMNTFNTKLPSPSSVCIIIVFHLQRQTAQNTNSARVCRRSAQLNTKKTHLVLGSVPGSTINSAQAHTCTVHTCIGPMKME